MNVNLLSLSFQRNYLKSTNHMQSCSLNKPMSLAECHLFLRLLCQSSCKFSLSFITWLFFFSRRLKFLGSAGNKTLCRPIAVITVAPAVKYSFVSKGMQTRRTGQHKAKLTLSLPLHVKPLITVITAIRSVIILVVNNSDSAARSSDFVIRSLA